MLDAQRLRAARVVFDIGVHLGLQAPEEWGGGTWTAEKGWPFLLANVNMPEQFVRFEFNRYLGWPGQAPSYKVGQRVWESIRDEVAAREGAAGSREHPGGVGGGEPDPPLPEVHREDSHPGRVAVPGLESEAL